MEPIIAILETLAVLEPEVYQIKLKTAQMALVKLQEAQSYMAKGNFYLAYLASHKSYRIIPTGESKKILIKTESMLSYAVGVHTNIGKSFQYLPEKIPELLSKYQNLPILEWDLIEINSVLGQLRNAAKALNSSLLAIEREHNSYLFPEIEKWQAGIRNQQGMIQSTQNYLIDIALSDSAVMLQTLNIKLTEESANLLSLVRSSLAEAAIQPYFIQAKKDFEPYANLAINLSLSSSLTQRNTHAKWYSHWSSIEMQVLEYSDSFSEYPKAFPDREKVLSTFKQESKIRVPNLEQGFLNLDLFISKHESIYGLIETLDRDRIILNYGLSST
ncbi:hypothetical protein [Colwellia psychrerythraea]|uniref:Uncharacterized protein n=1 Tax=Colwellia psychrerythraea TaxID=28229 RepID=A0A099L374_COLPS|nr:hypothetical protein [Colwellia psychrerythraea]KGJ97306.1 hypothetical protein GAB14E_0895 [Colwellia psychrerythraea]